MSVCEPIQEPACLKSSVTKQTSFRSPDPYPRTGIRRYLLSSWQVHGFT